MDLWEFVSNRRLRPDPLGDFLYRIKAGEIPVLPTPASRTEFKTILPRQQVSTDRYARNAVLQAWCSHRDRYRGVAIGPAQNRYLNDELRERNARVPQS